jgi:hypothetical protein
MVYKKFQEESYPTDQVERTKFLKRLNIATWPDEVVMSSLRRPPLPSNPQKQKAISKISPSFEVNNVRATHQDISSIAEHYTDDSQWSAELCQRPVETDFVATSSDPFHSPVHVENFEDTFDPSLDLLWPDLCQEDSGLDHTFLDSTSVNAPKRVEIYSTSRSAAPSSDLSGVADNEPLGASMGNYFNNVKQISESVDLRSRRTSLATTSSSSDVPSSVASNTLAPFSSSDWNARSVPWAKAKRRYNRCCTPEKRSSSSTNDSAYDSGRNTPLMPLGEHEQIHPRSLIEFRGLYRAPCSILHEPQPFTKIYVPQSQNRFREVPICDHCHYSGIHNLSWSCRYHKLEVFLAELNLQGISGQTSIYDVGAIDVTGNSALHYAASGGAGYDHFSALIRAGANPFQLNTAGQLFLHCLRPYLRKDGFQSFDENLVSIFNADLINLMNDFQPSGAFRWPDNEGQTPLDYLALRLTDSHIRWQTFQ